MQAANPRIVGDLVAQLYALETLQSRFDYYQKTVCKQGFDAVCFSFEPRNTFNPELERPPVFEISERFPVGFLKAYKDDGWFQHDFTIREIMQGDLSAKDWKQKELSGELHDKEKELIQLAREQFGINNAITIPTMNHTVGIAGASIVSFADDEDFTILKQQQLNTLIHCTRVFNDIIMQHPSHLVKTFVFPNLPGVTKKERIVLRDLVRGLPIQKIGAKQGMNESSVSNHLARLRKKFNVKKTSDLKHLLVTLNIMDYL